jgi:alginate O-acetyltransferase complex protein AlgI
MLFNSYKFFIFFAVVIGVFFAMPHRFRWLFLLASSYFYYMCWDPKYALLILATTFIVYGSALLMHGRDTAVKKLIVAFCVLSNLGILFLFKYFNFFNESMAVLFDKLGLVYSVPALNLLMPIGISFYTFQALSYTIDVYRGTREPEKHFGIFALYVSFFPVLLSGPIERSTTLLPQFYREVEVDYNRMTDGLKLMAWGFFQKLVIADRLGQYVNMVYNQPQAITGLPLALATYLFVFQVYCDFSGYTDIAIGTAQVMGYRLMPNFRRPYFASSLGELWRRWHISLITWFRDYLYIPLGGNRVPQWRFYVNMIIVFTLSGLWHGAQWTYVIWGSLNGVLLMLGRVTQRPRDWFREGLFGKIGKVPATAYFTLAAALAGLAAAGSLYGVLKGSGPRVAAGLTFIVLLSLGALRTSEALYERFVVRMKKFWMIAATFHLFVLGAVFFRSRNVADAWYILTHFTGTNFNQLTLTLDPIQFAMMILVAVILNIIHLIQEKHGSIRELIRQKPAWVRWTLYSLLCASILLFGLRGEQQFIYFRF